MRVSESVCHFCYPSLSRRRTLGRNGMKSTRTVVGHSLAPLTHLLAHYCLLPPRAPLRSFIRSLDHLLAPALMKKKFMSMNWMRQVQPTVHSYLVNFGRVRVCVYECLCVCVSLSLLIAVPLYRKFRPRVCACVCGVCMHVSMCDSLFLDIAAPLSH